MSTLNGHPIRQKPTADVLVWSLEQAGTRGRGIKNLHDDVYRARGKVHGSAIQMALTDLRKAGIVVMVGKPGSRRNTYYLAKFAPGKEASKPDLLTVLNSTKAAIEARQEREAEAPTDVLIAADSEAGLPAEAPVMLPYPPEEAAALAQLLNEVYPEPPAEAPAPAAPEATQPNGIPPAVLSLADIIAEQVRAAVIRLCGEALARAYEDRDAAEQLAEEAERRYNDLKAKLQALTSEG